MSSNKSKEPDLSPGNPSDSTDISDSSFETKEGTSVKNDGDINAQKSQKDEDSDDSSLKLTLSKGNDSSIKLVMDSTPEITKVPDSQYSEGESMGVTSQASTVEIESSETTTEKVTFSPGFGIDESLHKRSSLQPGAKGTIFIKNEDDHSFHISQDEIFGSHSGVVSSTPQSINPRSQSKVDHIDVDVVPSSPEEKKMNSYTLMPALSGGKRYLGRERRILSLTKSPKKEDRKSPIIMEECNPIQKPQDRGNDDEESQETLYKGSEEIPDDEFIGDEQERPKSGVKRKFEEILNKEGGPSTSKCISSDEEVEIVDVKKPRKSVEYVGSKLSSLLPQKCASPSNRSYSSKSSSNTSSQSSTSSQKTVRSKKLHRILESPKKIDDSMFRRISNSEEYHDEEFTLHMSPSQGSQLDAVNASSSGSVESSSKECKSNGAMSTILEDDEGCPDDLHHIPKENEVVSPENKDAGDNQSVEVATDCEVSGERSSCEAIRPSSPEYLSDDQAKSWVGLSSKPLVPIPVEGNKKKVSDDEGKKVTSEDKETLPKSTNETGKTEAIPELKDIVKNGKENGNDMLDPASELVRNGDPGPPKVHHWLVLHVCSDVDAGSGQYLSTRLVEMFDYRQETAKEYPKMKFSGRVSDISKASSVESKSSAYMGDISSPPTTVSPQSTSGEGKMFPLPPPRSSIMSTFSHSSSSTSGSDLLLNPKVLDVPKFTKPFLPSNPTDDRIPNLREVIPEIKTGRRVKIEATSGASDAVADVMQAIKSDCEQWCYKYVVSTNSSQASTPKIALEEASKVIPCDRRYLTRRPKTKRASLRMKRKISTSSKTVMPQSSSGSNRRPNGDEIDTVEEKSSCTSAKLTECPSEKPTEEVGKVKQRKRKSSRSSQASSENGNESRSAKSSRVGSPVHTEIEAEIPMTPGSSTLKTECKDGIVNEGALVFARFGDQWYYPGKVRERDKGDRWIIDFDDGTVKSIVEKFIVAVEVKQGESVYANVGDTSSEYEFGFVMKIETKKNQVYHTIEFDNGKTKIFPRSKLAMTEDQAKVLQMLVDPVLTTPKRKADVSLDNLLESRTRRKKTSSSASSITAGPSTPGPSKRLSAKKLETTVYESSSMIGTTSDCGELDFEGIPGLEPSVSPEPIKTPGTKGKGPGRRKGTGKQLNMSESSSSVGASTKKSSSAKNELGPIPPKGSSLFKGKYFILSYGSDNACSSQSQEGTKSLTDTSTDGDGTDTCEEKEFSSLPFDKKHLRRQLEAGGGRVFDHFKDECIGKLSFLISNRPNSTPDYVLAISADILIVSHEWVINCCAKNEQLPWEDNLLSIGWSVEKRRFIESHERSKKALKNVEVVLASDSGHRFLEFWRRVLVMAGAHVRKVSSRTMSSQEDISYAAVVVTDQMCPEGILNRANETGIPVVSTVWVKQTLIHGEMRPFSGHLMYKYDYKDD